jgi:hypothetical protein
MKTTATPEIMMDILRRDPPDSLSDEFTDNIFLKDFEKIFRYGFSLKKLADVWWEPPDFTDCQLPE